MVKRLRSITKTFLLMCRCSWGMWWCNRNTAAPWSTVDFWSREGQVRRNTSGSWDTWVPGGSREHCPQERGAVMGHCHRQVCVHSRLQHRQISCALLWSKTHCLPVPHAGLSVGKSQRTPLPQMWIQISPLDLLSCLFVECVVWEVQCPDAAGYVQTDGWTLDS